MDNQQHEPAIFIGGPLNGQIVETIKGIPEFVAAVDGESTFYLRNTLRARSLKMVAFTVGILDTNTIIRAAMMHPEGTTLWIADDGQ